MSLQTRLASLVTAIGTDIKSLNTSVAALQALTGSQETLAAQWTNSTTTATNIFAGLSPVLNRTYEIEALIVTTSAATTTGLQLSLFVPTGMTYSAVKITTAQSASTEMISYSAGGTFQASAAGLTTATLAHVRALVRTSGVALGAGNIRVQGRSEVAGSAVTAEIGSFMRWRVIS